MNLCLLIIVEEQIDQNNLLKLYEFARNHNNTEKWLIHRKIKLNETINIKDSKNSMIFRTSIYVHSTFTDNAKENLMEIRKRQEAIEELDVFINVMVPTDEIHKMCFDFSQIIKHAVIHLKHLGKINVDLILKENDDIKSSGIAEGKCFWSLY